MFDVSRNKVGVVSDSISVVNRVRLLMLTDPTELYNDPQFGLGLRKYLWQYNTKNVVARIQDNIIEQLRFYEPACDPEGTSFADGLLFTGDETNDVSATEFNKLKMTVGVQTKFGEKLTIDLNFDDLQDKIDYSQDVYKKVITSEVMSSG